jgi:hypothetical protein
VAANSDRIDAMPEQHAEVIDVPGLDWDGGAPLPTLVATDYRTLFACYRPTEMDEVVVAEFERCSSVRFGLPNDEVIHGHACGMDLMHYAVHVIRDSPWLHELRTIESVHPRAAHHSIATASHFFVTFHDSSLEAIAHGISVVGSFGSMMDAVAEMVRRVDRR